MDTRKRLLSFLTFALLALGVTVPVALAANAQTITVVERQVDVNPGETNPCTGATGTIADDEQDVFHITTLATGSLELSGHGTARVSFVPDETGGIGYAGEETFNFAATGNGPAFTTTVTTHLRLHGTDGSFIAIGEVAHLTVTADSVRVDFDRPTFACS
jgi:hypothetical protein